jgi:hypothetical protein
MISSDVPTYQSAGWCRRVARRQAQRPASPDTLAAEAASVLWSASLTERATVGANSAATDGGGSKGVLVAGGAAPAGHAVSKLALSTG